MLFSYLHGCRSISHMPCLMMFGTVVAPLLRLLSSGHDDNDGHKNPEFGQMATKAIEKEFALYLADSYHRPWSAGYLPEEG